MQKPITLIIEEFQRNLGAAVNDSGLPFFIMEPVVKELLENIQYGAKRQAEIDREAYNEYLQKQAAQKTEEAASGDKACSAPDNAVSSEMEG